MRKPWYFILFGSLFLSLTQAQTNFRVNLRDFYNPASPPADFHDVFETAIMAVYNNGGGTLEINPGQYKVCSSVDIHPTNGPSGFPDYYVSPTITIRGAGGISGTTKIFCPDAFATAGVTNPAFFKFRLPSPGDDKPYSVIMEHLAIEGNSGVPYESVTGVFVQNRESAYMKDVRFELLRKGLWVQYGGGFVVNNCRFAKISEYGVDGSESGNSSISRSQFSGIGCRNSNACGSARDWSAAIYIGGDVNIHYNIIGTCWNAAIKLRQGSSSPDIPEAGENSITDNSFDSHRYVLLFDSTASGDSITNCLFSGNKVAGWTGYPGSNFGGSTALDSLRSFVKGKHIAGLQIKNNRFAGLSKSGIGFDIRSAKDVQIIGNTFAEYWQYTRQPILGTLFKFQNSTQVNVSDNKIQMGGVLGGSLVTPTPLIAQFINSEGAFKFNTVNGYASGISQDYSSRISFQGNSGAPEFSSVFNDAAGWPTIPQNSTILIPDYAGGGTLRKSDYSKTIPTTFTSNAQPADILTIRVPNPGTPYGSIMGGNFKLKIYTRQYYSGTDYHAVFNHTVAVSNFAGTGGGLKVALNADADYDITPGNWGNPTVTWNQVSGSGYKDVNVAFAVAAPGNTPYQIRVQVEYEEWGGLKVK